MIKPGDKVTHKTFPPAEGVVTGAQAIPNSEPKIAVMRDNGSLFWDYLSTWDLAQQSDESDIEVNNGNVVQKITSSYSEDDIIDVEYTIIE